MLCSISKLYLFKVVFQRETNAKYIKKVGNKDREEKPPFLSEEGWTLEIARWYIQADGPEQSF